MRSVTATGTVNPVITVQVGTYVSGPITAIYADYNAPVKKGQAIAKIDPRPYQVTVDIAHATLANSKAQLGKDQADLAYKKVTYERNLALFKADAVSKDAVDSAYSAWQMDVAQVKLDHANIQQQTANVAAAEVNLNYTNIVSPVDGTVVSRNVDVGQTVAASFQTPTLFLIAQDLTKMQVDSNVSESDIGYVKTGQKADLPRRRVPRPRFRGHRRAGAPGADHRAERRDLRRRGERRESRAAAQARDDRERQRRHGVEGQRGAGADRRAALCASGAAAGGFRGDRRSAGPPDPGVDSRGPRSHAGHDHHRAQRRHLGRSRRRRSASRGSRGDGRNSHATTHPSNGIAQRHRRRDAASASLVARTRRMNTVIQIVGMTKTYVLGDIEVHALRGRRPDDRARRVRRGDGRVGLGQIDADEHARMPGPADQRPLHPRGRGRRATERVGAGDDPQPANRIRLSELQPALADLGARERRAAAVLLGVDRRRRAVAPPTW